MLVQNRQTQERQFHLLLMKLVSFKIDSWNISGISRDWCVCTLIAW